MYKDEEFGPHLCVMARHGQGHKEYCKKLHVLSTKQALSGSGLQGSYFQCSHCHHLPYNSVKTDCGQLLCVQHLDSLFRARIYSCPKISRGKPLKEDGRLYYFKEAFVNSKVLQIPVAVLTARMGVLGQATPKISWLGILVCANIITCLHNS